MNIFPSPTRPPSAFLLASLLLISRLVSLGQAKSITYIVKDNDLRNDCAFDLDGNFFDLCPLIGSPRIVEGQGMLMDDEDDRGEGSSSERRFYELALGGKRFSGSSSSDIISSSCDEGTWVCMSDLSTENEDVSDALGKKILAMFPRWQTRSNPVIQRTIDSRIAVTLDTDESSAPLSPLTLSLDGGPSERHQPPSEIAFYCSDVETLHFVDDDNGVHVFVWATPQGCPTSSSSFSTLAADQPATGGEKENKPDEKQGGDDDLLPSDRHKKRRRIAITMAVLVTMLGLGFIFASSARARHFVSGHLHGAIYTFLPVLSVAAAKLRPLGDSINHITSTTIVRVGSTFRQGDSKLVQWAQEDMSLLSEDTMVNGSGAYNPSDADVEGWDADGLDEYIPLTISPKSGKGRRVRSYGATPEVATFEESGTMRGIAKYFRR